MPTFHAGIPQKLHARIDREATNRRLRRRRRNDNAQNQTNIRKSDFKLVGGFSRHDKDPRPKCELRTAVYPSNMARITTKLCQNAFQMIPNVSFFDAKKICFSNFFDQKFRFSPRRRGFGRPTDKRTSKSACGSNFALEPPFLRSVRPKFVKILIGTAEARFPTTAGQLHD